MRALVKTKISTWLAMLVVASGLVLVSGAGPAAAATVSIDLCALPGTATLTGAVTVPIWGFGVPTTPGDCSTATASLPGPQLVVTLNATETTVNSLSRRPMGNLQQVNLDEVSRTRAELTEVQGRLAGFQGANAVVPTAAPVTAALGLVGGLDSQIAQLRAEYASMLQTFQPSSAQAQAVQGKINALETERQRAVERALSAPGEGLGGWPSRVSRPPAPRRARLPPRRMAAGRRG